MKARLLQPNGKTAAPSRHGPPLLARRLSAHPVLEPDPDVPWRAAATFNPTACVYGSDIHLLFRATSQALPDGWLSCIGLATSRDGLHFEVHPHPVVKPPCDPFTPCRETRGVEDPRISFLEDSWYLLTTAFGARYPGDWGVTVRASSVPYAWPRMGTDPLGLPGCKNAALLPERVDGRLWLYFRPPTGEIWVASGPALGRWDEFRVVLRPLPGRWDSARVGIGPAPLRLPDGRWLMIYHGADEANVYRLGMALLHPDRPWEVLTRQEEPLLEPALPWERDGLKPDVVFACGMIWADGDILLYYGAADTVTGAAVLPRNRLRSL